MARITVDVDEELLLDLKRYASEINSGEGDLIRKCLCED
jgi:hypothetical protein